MQTMYGRTKPGYAQAVADELGERVKYWPHSTFGKWEVATPRRKRRSRKRQM